MATKQLIQININGRKREAMVEPRLLLVHLIRSFPGLTGTHIGCDTSHCGACTVQIDGQAASQRWANQKLNDSLKDKLVSQGLIFNTPDKASFREKLASSGFYTAWKAKFTPQLWSTLEQYTGPFA